MTAALSNTDLPGRVLDAAERSRFDRAGALAPVRALPPEDAAGLLAAIESLEARRGGRLSRFANAKPHLLVPFLWDLVQDGRIVDTVEDLIGPDLLCIGSSFIDKAPGTSAHVAWHQDATYWGLSEPRAVTAWLALTPSTPESGCVRVLPGTHRTALPHEDSNDPDNLLGGGERVRDRPDPSSAVDLVLAPGEMSLHHPLVVHGSDRNTASRRRIGFAIRYIPGDVWQEGGSATLVRGRPSGRMPLEERPSAEFAPDAVARHADVVRRGARVLAAARARHLAAVAPPEGAR